MTNVKIIKERAFISCSNLRIKDFILPLVEEIGEEAFKWCGSIVKLNLPKTKTICRAAFKYCSGLRKIDLCAVENLYDEAFWFSSVENINPYCQPHEFI